MRFKAPLLAVFVMVVSAALIFWFFQRQLSSASLAFGSHPEVLAAFESSLDDLKRLAELDPENEAKYREQFDRLATTTNRLRILEHTHGDLVGRYEAILLGVFALSVVLVTGIYVFRQSRHAPRLARLQQALTRLAEGHTDIQIGDGGRDTIGRIAEMVEQTSRRMARDRNRLAALRHLSSWQEAARRHAHEIRTPLTGAKLELTKVEELLVAERFDRSDEMLRAATGAQQAIDRLAQFTSQFHQFARLPEPNLVPQDIGSLLHEMCETYASTWPNLVLELQAQPGIEASVDRDLLRQVLVNLLDNSSQARQDERGVVGIGLDASTSEVSIEISDNGPGVASKVQDRLFEPYVTTKEVGKGIGLGLPISKKIMLDHGGDLELLDSDTGARFRLTLPRNRPGESVR